MLFEHRQCQADEAAQPIVAGGGVIGLEQRQRLLMGELLLRDVARVESLVGDAVEIVDQPLWMASSCSGGDCGLLVAPMNDFSSLPTFSWSASIACANSRTSWRCARSSAIFADSIS